MAKLIPLASSPWATVYKDGQANVCLKECHHDVPPHNAARELAILKSIKDSHVNVIHLLASETNSSGELCMTFPLYQWTLLDYLKAKPLSYSKQADLLAGLAEAVQYLHEAAILHRDINPSNVLVKHDEEAPIAVLCDFGIAWHPDHPGDEKQGELICEIGTGPFRAPELLFGLQDYNASVDLWALGVTFAQVLHPQHKTLFISNADASDLQLIASIFRTRGTPTIHNWRDAQRCPSFRRFQFIDFDPMPWFTLLPGVPDLLATIVAELVQYNTVLRLSAKRAAVALRAAAQSSINSASSSSSK